MIADILGPVDFAKKRGKIQTGINRLIHGLHRLRPVENILIKVCQSDNRDLDSDSWSTRLTPSY